MWELNLNRVNADEVLARLELTDPDSLELIEESLERLAKDPAEYEHEPIPGDDAYPQPKRFLMRCLSTEWLVAWAYLPSRKGIVVGKIFHASEIPESVSNKAAQG